MRRSALVIVVFLFLLTGCWNRKELNELAFVMGMSIDLAEDDGYLISIQVANAGQLGKESSGLDRSTTTRYTVKAPTIMEAVRKMSTISPRRLYFSHMRMLLLGENLVRKEGFQKPMDFLLRDHEARTNFYVVVAKGREAKDLLNIFEPIESIASTKFYNSVRISKDIWAETVEMDIGMLMNELLADGKEPVIAGLQFRGDIEGAEKSTDVERISPFGYVEVGTIGVFKGDRLLGWLSAQESRGYNYLRGNVVSTAQSITCGKGERLTLEITGTKAEVIGSWRKGKPHFRVDLFVEQRIAANNCPIDLFEQAEIDKVNQKSEQLIQTYVTQVIKGAQQTYQSDFIGFGEVMYRHEPRKWKEIRDRWDQLFPQAETEIHVTTETYRSGKIGNISPLIEKEQSE